MAQKARQLEKDRGRYLYRAMAQDGSDMNVPHPASSQGLTNKRFVDAVFVAVDKGSKKVSPFLHFSWNFIEARNWHMRGRVVRGEDHAWMARVSVKALADYAASCQDKSASTPEGPCAVLGQILDLSTARGQHEAFGKLSYDPMVTDHVAKLGICRNHKEVLVPFRGCLPPQLFEVINPDTGLKVLLLGRESSRAGMGRESSRMANEFRGRTEKAYQWICPLFPRFFCSPPLLVVLVLLTPFSSSVV